MTLSDQVKNSNYVIMGTASLKQAMEAITYNHRGCIVVVGQTWEVIGVASDGDIRRAMVKGATTETPVEKVVNMNCLVVKKGEVKDPEKFFADNPHNNVIPVVNDKNKLVDVLVRGGAYKDETIS